MSGGETPAKKGRYQQPGDKFCVYCRWLIFKQAKDKLDKCPNRNCLQELPFRTEHFQFELMNDKDPWKWGRCPGYNCDEFTSDKYRFLFCQSCGFKNPEAVERIRRKEKSDSERLRKEKESKIKSLEHQLKEATAKLEQTEKDNEELKISLKSADDSYMKVVLEVEAAENASNQASGSGSGSIPAVNEANTNSSSQNVTEEDNAVDD